MRNADGERGVALIIVAVSLAVLTLMIAAVMEIAHRTALETSQSVDELRLNAALDAATADTTYAFATGGADIQTILSRRDVLSLNGAIVSVRIRPESARVNLNRAGKNLILSLLLAHGLDRGYAGKLAGEIDGWRTRDDAKRAQGAQAADYLMAGKRYVPPEDGFSAVSELALLIHGSNDLAACLGPDVTVFGDAGDVDTRYASAVVRSAAQMAGLAEEGGQTGSIVGGRAVMVGDVYEADARARDAATGRVLTRRTIFRVTGSRLHPVAILQVSLIPGEDAASEPCARLARKRVGN